MTVDPRTIVQMLANHELALKQLYQTYALRFAQFNDFWLKLATDEQHHADWLNSLLAKTGPTHPLAPCCWPKPKAIESSLQYIRVEILRACRPEVTIIGALSIALDLENSLLEKEFFKVAEGSSPEVREILGRLVTGTEGHRQAVQKALDQAKRDIPESV